MIIARAVARFMCKRITQIALRKLELIVYDGRRSLPRDGTDPTRGGDLDIFGSEPGAGIGAGAEVRLRNSFFEERLALETARIERKVRVLGVRRQCDLGLPGVEVACAPTRIKESRCSPRASSTSSNTRRAST
jgi:hypothetical protein